MSRQNTLSLPPLHYEGWTLQLAGCLELRFVLGLLAQHDCCEVLEQQKVPYSWELDFESCLELDGAWTLQMLRMLLRPGLSCSGLEIQLCLICWWLLFSMEVQLPGMLDYAKAVMRVSELGGSLFYLLFSFF